MISLKWMLLLLLYPDVDDDVDDDPDDPDDPDVEVIVICRNIPHDAISEMKLLGT
jgi:hypothetical protein